MTTYKYNQQLLGVVEQDLQKLGLTKYESMLYLTLVKEGLLTGGMASKSSGVPQGKTYEVLHNLIFKGFAREIPGPLKQFEAVSPGIAIRRYARVQINNISDIQQTLVNELPSLTNTNPLSASIGERVSLLSGLANIRAVSQEMANKTSKEFLLMFTYEQMWSETLSLLFIKVKEGLDVCILATKATKDGLVLMKEHRKQGIDVRYYPVEELRITVVDAKEALVMIVNPRNKMDRIGMHAKSGEFSKMIKHYFEALWKKAKRITPSTTLKELEQFSYRKKNH